MRYPFTTRMCFGFSAAALLVGLLPSNAAAERAVASAAAGPLAGRFETAGLIDLVRRRGSVALIVGLDFPLGGEAALSGESGLAQAQGNLVRRAGGRDGFLVRAYRTLPYLAVRATEIELLRLLADPSVKSIEEDVAFRLQLDQSTKLIKAPSLWNKGIRGKGQAVAVLDSGVDASHPMLKGKVVSEACYSTDGGGFRSLCPSRAASSTAPGSAKNCDPGMKDCEHGTYVASIAAGRSPVHWGVAPGADIIAIKVVSKERDCSGACLFIQQSDLIAGLERVYKLRKTFKIAAANISLGVPTASPQNCDALFPSLRDAVAKLRKAGIATIAASGNGGLANAVYAPACLSSVISVAATTDFDNSWGDSNYAANIDLLAPGKDITAAVPPGSPCLKSGRYCTSSGTSAAAPHVAGAFALFRQIDPDAGIPEILAALSCTGKQVDRLELSRPRIDLLRARHEFLSKDKAERFPFDEASEADAWKQRLGTWEVAGGRLTLTDWPASGGDTHWAFAAHDYCSSSFKARALVHHNRLTGAAGLLLASNIEKMGSTVAVSGYYVLYNQNSIQVGRFDNTPLRGGARIEGSGAGFFCYAFNVPEGWNASLPHIVEMSVLKDGRYEVAIDGTPFCKFTDRFHPPPSKVAVIASKAKNDDDDQDRVTAVRMVSFTPIR